MKYLLWNIVGVAEFPLLFVGWHSPLRGNLSYLFLMPTTAFIFMPPLPSREGSPAVLINMRVTLLLIPHSNVLPITFTLMDSSSGSSNDALFVHPPPPRPRPSLLAEHRYSQRLRCAERMIHSLWWKLCEARHRVVALTHEFDHWWCFVLELD